MPGYAYANTYSCVRSGLQQALTENFTFPTTAWKTTHITSKPYSYMKETYNFELRLEALYDGETAASFAQMENMFNDVPEANEQWLIMKFHLRNVGSSQLKASNIYTEYFTESGASITIKGQCIFSDDNPNAYDVTLYPGASGYYWEGILIDKSAGYPLLRIRQEYDEENYQYLYTFLSTDPNACDHQWGTGSVNVDL